MSTSLHVCRPRLAQGAPARTAPGVLRAHHGARVTHDVPHASTMKIFEASNARLPPAAEGAPCHQQSGAAGCSGRQRRVEPPLSVQECVRSGPHPCGRAPRGPRWSAGAASRYRQRRAVGGPRGGLGAGSARRSFGLVDASDQDRRRTSRYRAAFTSHRAVRAWREPRRAPSQAGSSRARRARSQPRRQHRAWLRPPAGRSTRRAPQQCLRPKEIAELRIATPRSASAGGRCAGRPASGHRGDHPPPGTGRGSDQRVHRTVTLSSSA